MSNKEINVYSVSRFKDNSGMVWRVTGHFDYFGCNVHHFNIVNAWGTEDQVPASFIESGYDHE